MNHRVGMEPENFRVGRVTTKRRAAVVLAVLAAIVVGWLLRPRDHAPQPATPLLMEIDGEERLVAMQLGRSMTMSGSPPFTVTICTDGTASCDVEVPGPDRRTVRLPVPATAAVIAWREAAFTRAGFMRLRTAYLKHDVTCAPYYRLYRNDGAAWRFVEYYGGDESAPEALRGLVDEIELALDIDGLISIPEAAPPPRGR